MFCLIRSRFLLLLGNETEPSSVQVAKQLAEWLADVVDLRFTQHEGIILIRPDGYGYVACSSHRREGIAALQSVLSILKRQINERRQIMQTLPPRASPELVTGRGR